MAVHYLQGPLSDADTERLRLGDMVYLSGRAFTCRSRLQRYVFDEGHELPFSTDDRNILIHNGPIIIREDGKWKLVSFMPTSSIRFEKWGAVSVAQWNLKMIVGKTTMGKETAAMMKAKKCVHVSPRSVSPNLWIDSIEVEDVYLYEELGQIEAAWFFNLHKLGPFMVDIDTEGNNFFDALDGEIAARKEAALAGLGISPEFAYTKLY